MFFVSMYTKHAYKAVLSFKIGDDMHGKNANVF